MLIPSKASCGAFGGRILDLKASFSNDSPVVIGNSGLSVGQYVGLEAEAARLEPDPALPLSWRASDRVLPTSLPLEDSVSRRRPAADLAKLAGNDLEELSQLEPALIQLLPVWSKILA